MYLFGRRANLLFKPKNAAVGLDVSNLRVVFQITKSITKAANTAEIVVYNMSQSTRVYSQQKNMQVFLAAGYDEGLSTTPQLKLIYSGDILSQPTSKAKGDVLTKYEAGDSVKILQDARISKSFKSGTTVATVIDELKKQLTGVSNGELQNLLGKAFPNGYSAHGLVRDQLDVMALKTDTLWSIQDGKLQFLKVDGSTSEKAVFLTSDTGLIGSPSQKKINVYGVEKIGIDFVSLLQPEIKPGRKIDIDSEFVSGIFTCLKVVHRGDTGDGPWFSEGEAVYTSGR